MDENVKEKLLDMLQDISYAHEDGGFWKAWAEMHRYIWNDEWKKTEEEKA